MRVFEKTEQVTNHGKYKATALSGLKKVRGAPEKFFYVEKFKFEDKEAPLLLVGEVPKEILAEIKERIKTPAVQGKVKRAAAEDLTFAPAKGTLVPTKVDAVIKTVGGKDKSTIGKLDDDEEAVSRDKDAREEELEKLREANAKNGFQNRKEDAKSAISNMLQSTGRSEDPKIRDAKREQMAGQILGKMEDSVNARNADFFAKGIDPKQKPEAHHVTAHGPGTDQVSRLVSGHRNDEILKDQAAKGPLPTTKLTGNASVGDVTVPVYDKVGEGASNISGAFSSNTAMLHAIEEAYSHVTQLDSYIAAALKAATKTEYERVMKTPEAQTSLQRLQIGRKLVASLQAKLKKPGQSPKDLEDTKKDIAKFEAGIKVDYKNLQDTIKAQTVKPTLAPEFNVNNDRIARTVQPGTTGTKAFAPEGLGTGVEIDLAHGKQTSKADVAKDGKTAEQIMQERYDKIKTTPGQETAKVVMDPAYVDDGKGGKKRAGWDVQTAYPVNDKANQAMNSPGGSKAYLDVVKAFDAKNAEVVKAREDEKIARQAYEQAKKKREGNDSAIQAKKDKALPNQEKALLNAKAALAKVTVGTDEEVKAKELVDKTQKAVDATNAAILQGQKDKVTLTADENKLKIPADAAKVKLDNLVKELEVLEAQKG